MAEDSYTNVILEEIREQYRAILEYVQVIPEILTRLSAVEDKVDVLQDDMRLVKLSLRKHSTEISDLRSYITG